jgi:hypothetical protein
VAHSQRALAGGRVGDLEPMRLGALLYFPPFPRRPRTRFRPGQLLPRLGASKQRIAPLALPPPSPE